MPKKPKANPSPIRDRVREIRRVKGSDLIPAPNNWRVHPDSQRKALRGVLNEVGVADALKVWERPDGRLELIDGHLRAEELGDQEWPVLVLDVTEEEARYLLATHDPLGAMAQADGEALARLLSEFEAKDEAVKEMLAELVASAGQFETQDSPEVLGSDDRVDVGDRAGSSPWSRVKASDSVRCIVGDIEFSISRPCAKRFVEQIQGLNETVRESARQWLENHLR